MFLLINTNWCHCLCIWRKTQVSLSRHSWSTGKGMSSSFGRFRHHSLKLKGADSFWFHAENCKDLIWDSNIFILTRRQKAKYVLRLSILCLYFVFKPYNEHCSRSHLADYKYERYLHEETKENTFKRSRELRPGRLLLISSSQSNLAIYRSQWYISLMLMCPGSWSKFAGYKWDNISLPTKLISLGVS